MNYLSQFLNHSSFPCCLVYNLVYLDNYNFKDRFDVKVKLGITEAYSKFQVIN